VGEKMNWKGFLEKKEKLYGDIVWTNFYKDSIYALENPEKCIKDSEVIELKDLREWADSKIKELLMSIEVEENYVTITNYEGQIQILKELKEEGGVKK
jgi:hypothetical protein